MTGVYARSDIEEASNRVQAIIDVILSQAQVIDAELTFLSATSSAKRLRPAAALDRSIYDLIMSHAMKAEALAPGAFRSTLALLAVMRTLGSSADELRRSMVGLERSVQLTRSEVDERMRSFFFTAQESEMVRKLFECVGLGTKVRIERARSSAPSVEISDGYSFGAFSRMKMLDAWRPSLVRCLCVDGYIESVSEIHRVLTELAETKEPLAMFCRGCSDDVLNTLSVNFARQTLNVVPFEVPLEFDGINTLADLSVACGCDVITSDKGQLISTVSVTSIPAVDAVHYVPQSKSVIVLNERTKPAVRTQYQKILALAKDADEFRAKLYEKRLVSLSSNYATVRLPENADFELRAERLDLALRSFSQLIKHGIVEFDERSSVLRAAFGPWALTTRVHAAFHHSLAASRNLDQLGSVCVR